MSILFRYAGAGGLQILYLIISTRFNTKMNGLYTGTQPGRKISPEANHGTFCVCLLSRPVLGRSGWMDHWKALKNGCMWCILIGILSYYFCYFLRDLDKLFWCLEGKNWQKNLLKNPRCSPQKFTEAQASVASMDAGTLCEKYTVTRVYSLCSFSQCFQLISHWGEQVWWLQVII